MDLDPAGVSDQDLDGDAVSIHNSTSTIQTVSQSFGRPDPNAGRIILNEQTCPFCYFDVIVGPDPERREAASRSARAENMQRQTLVEDHPFRLASQQVLATFYWEFGDRNAAFRMMKHVVVIERQVLHHDHSARTNSEAWLEIFEQDMTKAELAES